MTNTIKFYIPKSWLGVIVFSRSSLLNMGTFLVSTVDLVLIHTSYSQTSNLWCQEPLNIDTTGAIWFTSHNIDFCNCKNFLKRK